MISILYPSINPSSGRFRNCSIYATGRGYRDSRRGGRFYGRVWGIGRGGIGVQGREVNYQGGCGGGIIAFENGIDISDSTRYSENSEWSAISNVTSKRITEDPICKKFLANKKRSATSSVSAGKDNDNFLIPQIITGVKNSSRNESGLAVGLNRLPTNDSRAQVFAVNRSSTSSNINEAEERSVVIYNFLGNLLTKYWLE